MALLFLDSFDHYSDPADKYLSGGGTIVTGRHGNGLQGGECRVALIPASARVVIGAAFNLGSTFNEIFEIHDIAGQVCTITTENDGALEITMFGGPSARTDSDVLHLSTWHYIELDLTIQINVAGGNWTYSLSNCDAYIDGVQVLNTTLGASIAVTETSAYGWSHIDILPTGSLTIIDDLYILDGSGAMANAPLGDVQIDVIRPNGAGASTGWTASGAATNWDCVNDLTPDGDTTRVTATAAATSDLYEMENVDTDDTILGAQLLVSARRTDEGFATLAALLRHAAATTELTTRGLATSYFYRNRECFTEMPNSDALTDANVNALQAGIRRIA